MEKFRSSPAATPEQRLGSAPYSVGGSAYNGICPSCGFEKEKVADRYCELCTLARSQETMQALIRRAVESRPANEDRVRGMDDDDDHQDPKLVAMAKAIGRVDGYRRHE